MKFSETEIRKEIHRIAKMDELGYWERAIDHFHRTGGRIYCEYGNRFVVSEWCLARHQEIKKNYELSQ